MHVAIYARMSTDRQSEDSPADQIARCRTFALARGWTVLEELVIEEPAVSGATRHNRPGLLQLFDRIDEWDVLLAWDVSRLSRDAEDQGWIRNRLRARKRTAFDVLTGLEMSNVGAKVLGIFAEEQLEKIRQDTRRGLLGRAERGLSTGGLAYGYRSEPVALDARGLPDERSGWRVVVDEDRAAVVLSIFTRFLSGHGLREIAHALNREAVAPPRPRALAGRPASWSPTAIREMLRNPIYRGERIFNRSEWVKDHESGRRRRFERPESEWTREDRPDLAIIDAATWDATLAEIERRAHSTPYLRAPGGQRLAGTLAGRGHRGPARHPLSGFLECGSCGGSFHVVKGSAWYGCGWRRARGPTVCQSGVGVARAELEARVLGAIRERYLVQEVIEIAVQEACAEVERQLSAPVEPEDARVAERLAALDDELATVRRLAERTGQTRAAARMTAALEDERRRLQHPRSTIQVDADLLREIATARALEMREALAGAPSEMRDALRALLRDRRIRVYPDAEKRFRIEGILELALESTTPGSLAETGRRQSVVAGGGFEPPTSGL